MAICLKNIGLLLDPQPGGTWREVRGAALLFDEKIIEYGPESEILGKAENADVLDAGGHLVTPGLVDSHTHPAFAEPRVSEFEMRNRGKSYREIAESGGGIRSSVRSLREISEDDLVERMLPRLNRFLEYGVTTLEAKSGYGLSTEQELKQLRAIQRCNRSHPVDLVPTLLAAHEIPDEFSTNREAYLDLVINETIPAAAQEGLAKFCDVFCEEGVFSVAESRRVLQAGQQHGLLSKIHADQLSWTGGAELAAELGATSAEHLDYISDEGIGKMVTAGVNFTLLPGAVIFLGLTRYPPARRILEMGGTIALATDFNPGSSATQNLSLIMTLAAVFCRMSTTEVLWAATRGGANALKLEDRIGSLTSGCRADLVVWECADERLIPYFFGMNLVADVFKAGLKVVERGRVLPS